jgi:hypothetical protein
VRWRNENGTDLAENLAPLELALITRNGNPGGPNREQGFDPVEYSVYEQSLTMHDRLTTLRIPHLWDDQGPGGHDWYYWQRDLEQILPSLTARFANPPRRPARVTYKRADPDYKVFGWKVHLERPALEFSTLSDARRRGFTLAGSGTGRVRTPRFFRPGSTVRARLRTDEGKTVRRRLTATRRGRVRLKVPLGPGNPAQQYTAEAAAAGGTQVFETRVRLRGRRR